MAAPGSVDAANAFLDCLASESLLIPRRVHATPRPLLRAPPLWHTTVGAVAVSDSESESGSAAAPPPPPPPPRTSSRGALPPSQSSVAPPKPRPAPPPAAPWPTLSILNGRGWVGGVGGWSLDSASTPPPCTAAIAAAAVAAVIVAAVATATVAADLPPVLPVQTRSTHAGRGPGCMWLAGCMLS